MDSRASRWPPTAQLETEIDQLQRKMVAMITRVPRLPDETDKKYFQRRGRLVGNTCRASGLWSDRHCLRVLSYHEHMLRDRNGAWAKELLHTCDAEWLRRRRLAFGSSSVWAGRTETRAQSGHVPRRWHDGVVYAKIHLSGG